MENTTNVQWSILKSLQDFPLDVWIENFLFDRKVKNLSKGTVQYYKAKMKVFYRFCIEQNVTSVIQIDALLIRRYLDYLRENNHNDGGVSCAYRTLKAFLRWWENEVELEGWKNPIRKVPTPKYNNEIKEPVEIETVRLLISVCPKDTLTGLRDAAIFAFLLDTGVRSAELVAINLEDINIATGEIKVLLGKGRKSRTVYIGSKTRKMLRKYLLCRKDNNPALWITKHFERLSYWGLVKTVKYRSELAGIKPPQLHSFRRGFCINMLRSGVDIYSLQNLMGHADLQIMSRYIKITNQDTKLAHRLGSTIDNNF